MIAQRMQAFFLRMMRTVPSVDPARVLHIRSMRLRTKKLKSGSGALALRKVDYVMKNQLKKLAIALIGLPLLALILLDPATVRTNAAAEDFDPAAIFKAKCAMCHGAKAEKKFDAAKADDQLVETVLKGKEGTPKMPAYEKSFSPEQAKALVAYMKSLKQ